MRLYNTLTRSIDELKPIAPPKVTVYSCGPTVYDYPHIGNWFTFIRYDILIRALQAAGLKPDWVMNITDVGHLVSDEDEGEDKLEKGARREGKSAWQIAEFYSGYFVKGLGKLNITKPDELPRATEHIQEQIDLIKDLENKGFTYVISDGVYYDTSKFSDYGKLARLDIEHLKAGARVAINPEKKNPTDFALWKFSPKDQKRDMEWVSPWGKGFPGWHIECSAMSMKYLGQTLDIHAGGIDHIPVHHTNEIAQSEGATGKTFAHYWVHMNHITVKGEKVAKSTGNGITLEDIEAKGYSMEALRLLVLESHYRTQAEFSWENLEAAQNRFKSFQAFADLRYQSINPSEHHVAELDFTEYQKNISRSLLEDLDTPQVLATINLLIDKCKDSISMDDKESFINFLKFLDDSFGFRLLVSQDISLGQKEVINNREEARQSKDWTKSDGLRAELEKQGLGVRDTEHGPIWYRL